jgi:UDP-N-acetylmuramoyl-L-alanyl-D-glutamate--2,6-diaminopimelate ligase
MGEVASVNSDHIVINDDNTRGERAETILCDIVDGIDNKSGLTICRDRGQAIAHVLESADTDDLVLVLGKGNELMMDYGLNKVPHRDIDVVSHGVMSL